MHNFFIKPKKEKKFVHAKILIQKMLMLIMEIKVVFN